MPNSWCLYVFRVATCVGNGFKAAGCIEIGDLKPHEFSWGGVKGAYCMCLNNTFWCLIRCISMYSGSRNTLEMIPELHDAWKLVNLNFMDYSGGGVRVNTVCA